jgi:hypothetical protein
MAVLRAAMEHAKHHIMYPATRAQAVAACNNFSDVPKEDAEWFAKTLPDRTYRNADELMHALLEKI